MQLLRSSEDVQTQLNVSYTKKMAFTTNPTGHREARRKIQQGPEEIGKLAKFKVQSPYLSLALGSLQLEHWVGMASSTVLRHPEGTTNNKERRKKTKGG